MLVKQKEKGNLGRRKTIRVLIKVGVPTIGVPIKVGVLTRVSPRTIGISSLHSREPIIPQELCQRSGRDKIITKKVQCVRTRAVKILIINGNPNHRKDRACGNKRRIIGKTTNKQKTERKEKEKEKGKERKEKAKKKRGRGPINGERPIRIGGKHRRQPPVITWWTPKAIGGCQKKRRKTENCLSKKRKRLIICLSF